MTVSIASVTLAGPGRENVIGDAVRSLVRHVDTVIVLDTVSARTDATIERASEAAGDKLRIVSFPWVNDFSAARNAALDAAHASGADWALSLDSDETLDVGQADLRTYLARLPSDVHAVCIFNRDQTYFQPRLFRLPAKGRYEGPTHERWISTDSADRIVGIPVVTFQERPKTADELQAKAQRDVAILTEHIALFPSEPRWHLFLGQSYAYLGEHGTAVGAYNSAVQLSTGEAAASACYALAKSLMALGNPSRAIDACALGLARHPGIAELAWLAGKASIALERYDDAICWAHASIALGLFKGMGKRVHRSGVASQLVLYEGPYDVLRVAYRALGEHADADSAEVTYGEAKRLRETSTGVLAAAA